MTRDEIEELTFFDMGTEIDLRKSKVLKWIISVYLLQKKKEKN
jgi:hypothetical protein